MSVVSSVITQAITGLGASAGVSAARTTWTLNNQISPIILNGGIATAQGGALPISTLLGGAKSAQPSLTSQIASGAVSELLNPTVRNATSVVQSLVSPDPSSISYFAYFEPAQGSSLINNQVATMPFANQTVAANAIIAQPLNISVVMICPVTGTWPYSQKLATLTALQNSLSQHNNLGGTYSIFTPAYIYTYCLMTGMRDITGGGKQVQEVYQLDFTQPLVTLEQATNAQNGLMTKLSNGSTIAGTPTWSPAGLPVGNVSNLLNLSLVPQTSIAPTLSSLIQ